MDQSESAPGAALSTPRSVVDWSSEFVSLTEVGPNLGAHTRPFNNADELCWTASSSAACASPPAGKTTYTYDTRGNRTAVTPTTGQAQTLTYDQANRLTKFAAASATSYGYNGDGLRMCKYAGSSTQPCQAGGTNQFLWDLAGSLPLLLKDGSTNYVYGPGGLPLEQVSGATTLWYHYDQIGSTRLVTNSTGVSQATYTYDPYGGLASSTGSVTNPFRFSGQYQDSESGYYYLRARYFDSSTGSFLTRDAAVAKTREPYVYVADSPLNRTDSTGLDTWALCGSYFAGAGLAWLAAACAGVAWDRKTGTISAGYTITGPEFGGPNEPVASGPEIIGCCGVSAGFTGQTSNASSFEQLGGEFVSCGAGFGKGIGSLSVNTQGSNPRIVVAEAGVGGGFPNAYVGLTNTYQAHTVASWTPPSWLSWLI